MPRLKIQRLNSSGKLRSFFNSICHRAAPQPRTRQLTQPRTHHEKAIHDIWATVLGTTTISTHDNFFELGGHSLLATQITTRIRRDFNIPLPLRAIFENPTITQLATTVEQLVYEEVSKLSPDEVQRMLDDPIA